MRSRGVTARVPAKVNLQLSVGPLGSDGFHEVTTVFQAISLFDDVTVATADKGEGIKISITGKPQEVCQQITQIWRLKRRS